MTGPPLPVVVPSALPLPSLASAPQSYLLSLAPAVLSSLSDQMTSGYTYSAAYPTKQTKLLSPAATRPLSSITPWKHYPLLYLPSFLNWPQLEIDFLSLTQPKISSIEGCRGVRVSDVVIPLRAPGHLLCHGNLSSLLPEGLIIPVSFPSLATSHSPFQQLPFSYL